MVMTHATQSPVDAEAWLRNHLCQDLLFIIRFQGKTDATEIRNGTKQFWKNLFRDEGEYFPNILRLWLVFLNNPKNPEATTLFYFARGVEGKSSADRLKDHLREEFRDLRTLRPFSPYAFQRVSHWFCRACGQGMLVAFVPMEFHTRYRQKPRF